MDSAVYGLKVSLVLLPVGVATALAILLASNIVVRAGCIRPRWLRFVAYCKENNMWQKTGRIAGAVAFFVVIGLVAYAATTGGAQSATPDAEKVAGRAPQDDYIMNDLAMTMMVMDQIDREIAAKFVVASSAMAEAAVSGDIVRIRDAAFDLHEMTWAAEEMKEVRAKMRKEFQRELCH